MKFEQMVGDQFRGYGIPEIKNADIFAKRVGTVVECMAGRVWVNIDGKNRIFNVTAVEKVSSVEAAMTLGVKL